MERNSEVRLGTLAWAAAAVGAGCILLAALGAPSRMPAMNGAALLIGLTGVAALWASRRAGASAKVGDLTLLVASGLVPLTALVGPQTDSVARWLTVGGLTIQPGMIIVPLIALGLALRASPVRSASVAVAALGLAMQPDPGCAFMLLLGVAAPLIARNARPTTTLVAATAAAIGFAGAISRNVVLPPAPFVEQVIQDALQAGSLTTLLALGAIFPMLLAGFGRPPRAPHLAFLGVWIAALAMALLRPYPTPVVGFGGSGVLGFILSAGLLALRRR